MAEETTLVVFDPAMAMVADLVKKDASQEFDHTTPEGEESLRSWVHRIKGGCGDIEKVRKVAKSGLITTGREIDARAKELTAPLRAIQAERMKPLDEIEGAKRAAAEAIVEAERVAAEQAEADKLADLKRREDAVAAKEAEIKVAGDAAFAELRETKRVEREKCIATEAAETATKLAEANAAREAEALKKSIEAAEDTKRLKTQQAEQAEKRRAENRANRVKVEEEAKSAMWAVLDRIRPKTIHDVSNVDLVMGLLIDIRDGKIPHVTINY